MKAKRDSNGKVQNGQNEGPGPLFLPGHVFPASAFKSQAFSRAFVGLTDQDRETLLRATADNVSRAANALLTLASVMNKPTAERFDAAYEMLMDQCLDTWLPPAVAANLRAALLGGPVESEEMFLRRLRRVRL